MRVSFMSTIGLLAAALAWQPIAADAQALPTGYNYSVTPIYHPDSDLDAGGESGFSGAFLSFGHTSSLNQQTTLGWRAHFDYENWSFSDPVEFAGYEPWDKFYRYGLSAPFTRVTSGGWILNVTPTVGYAGESGADFSDSIEYGATFAAMRRFSDSLRLGLGFGYFSKIEDDYFFPVLMVDWRINDKWSLANPTPSGPAGPAGLELSYAFGGGWDTGFGATQREERHRLDSDGPFPDGVGEHSYTVLFARLGLEIGTTARMNFYAGAETNTKLRVEDSNGNRLYSEEADTALMLGLSVVGRF